MAIDSPFVPLLKEMDVINSMAHFLECREKDWINRKAKDLRLYQLHELHDDLLHEVQPELPDEETGFSTPVMPKRENFFVMFFELHFGQETSGFVPETSFSKSSVQSLHLYSYIGIWLI